MAEVIKCDLYDHFEIACMRRSAISLELHSGKTIAGVASDLVTKEAKEFLVLKTDNTEQQINLLDIDVLILSNSQQRIKIS